MAQQTEEDINTTIEDDNNYLPINLWPRPNTETILSTPGDEIIQTDRQTIDRDDKLLNYWYITPHQFFHLLFHE